MGCDMWTAHGLLSRHLPVMAGVCCSVAMLGLAGAATSQDCIASFMQHQRSLFLVLQVAIFVFAVWSGTNNGGVIAGLAVAGFVMAATSSAGTLMQARGVCLAQLEYHHLLPQKQGILFSESGRKASGYSAKRMVHCTHVLLMQPRVQMHLRLFSTH